MRTRLAARTALTSLIALVLTSVLVATAPTSQAAGGPVIPRDLPTRPEVTHAVPGLKGLPMPRSAMETVRHYAGVCSTWTETEGRSGQIRSGEDYWTGRRIDIRVVQFRKKAEARALFATFQAFVRDCGHYWGGVDTAVQQEKLPKLGGPRLGYRRTEVPATGTNQAPSHYFTVVVRHGRRLLVIDLQQAAPPRKAQVVRLARVAARKMS